MNKKNSFGFGTDFHGNLNNYEKLFRESQERNVDHIIIGGDIAPKKMAITFSDGKGWPYPDSLVLSPDIPADDRENLIRLGYIPFDWDEVESADAQTFLSTLQKISSSSLKKEEIDPSIKDIRILEKYKHIIVQAFQGTVGQRIIERMRAKIPDISPEMIIELLLKKLILMSIMKDPKNLEKFNFDIKELRDADTNLYELEIFGFHTIFRALTPLNINRFQELFYIYNDIATHSEDGQIDNLKRLLREIQDLRQTFHGTISIILGNDDHATLLPLLAEADDAGLIVDATNAVRKLTADIQVLGYSHTPPLPAVNFTTWFRDEQDIAQDLTELAGQLDPAMKTVFNIHVPPHNTAISKAHIPPDEGDEFGSTAVRNTISDLQPTVSLHGHLHMPWKITGKVRDMVGKTYVYNPGASEYEPRFIFGNLADPGEYELYTE